MRQTIDTFLKKQHMDAKDFEIYNYSDVEIPSVMPHRHRFYEIYYLLSDQFDYVIGKRVYKLKKGDFILLPPGHLHYPSENNIKQGKRYSRIVLWCNVDFFERFAQIEPNLHTIWDTVTQKMVFHFSPTPGMSDYLYNHLLFLLYEKRKNGFASQGMMFATLMEIFVLISRIVRETQPSETHTTSQNTFVNIVYYIHTHITEPITLKELSQHFWVSKGYISKIFREYIGLSVHQYILSLRLDGSRAAIEKGMPIAQAAELFGFSDYSSFFRAFKKVFRQSPREYQKSL